MMNMDAIKARREELAEQRAQLLRQQQEGAVSLERITGAIIAIDEVLGSNASEDGDSDGGQE